MQTRFISCCAIIAATASCQCARSGAMVWKFTAYLREYCLNCSVAGLSYIANPNLHFLERIFWLVCVIACAVGSLLLISEYEANFESTSVSIVYESLPPNQNVHFPSVTVCDAMQNAEENDNVIKIVETLHDPYEFDLENILFNLAFPATHTSQIRGNCRGFEKSKGGIGCPRENYRQITAQILVNCSQYFESCSFAGKPFDCCRYFLPLTTPYGKCYLLNSLLNNKRNSDAWLDTSLDPSKDTAEMIIQTHRPFEIFVINEEDLPTYSFPSVSVKATQTRPENKSIEFSMETMVNDPDVRDVSPEARKCRFPDELLPNSRYKAYSFTTCYAECVRSWQIELCNCSLYNYLPNADDKIKDCEYEGFMCVDTYRLVQPDAKLMLPWAKKTPCNCLPSCDETDLMTVFSEEAKLSTSRSRVAKLSLVDWPKHRYRRQALRTRLDVVVTIGGILGLFMGVSILSGIEMIYYFTLRLCNSALQEKRKNAGY